MSTGGTYNANTQQESNNSCKSGNSTNNRSVHNPPQLDITKDEFQRISEALKKPEFRDLFMEYIDEIQDPKNRQLYEEEIKQIEAERGVEVTFINPKPGFVIKTSLNGNQKCFINCAKSVEVDKPTHEVAINPLNGERGLSWSIPLAQPLPRDDLDNNNKICRVYDVIFHPNALHIADRNMAFRNCLVNTALDAIEREFQVVLDRVNLKFPKMGYKGIARPTVIRRLAKNPPPDALEAHPLEDIYPTKPTAESGKPKILPMQPNAKKIPEFNVPNYRFKYRRFVDLSECRNELDAKLHTTVPHELVIEIDLPLLNSSAECQVDVTSKTLFLLSERLGAKYQLNITLPYTVNDKEAKATFDIDTRQLMITLPVVKEINEEQHEVDDHFTDLCRKNGGMDNKTTKEVVPASRVEETLLEELNYLKISDEKTSTWISSDGSQECVKEEDDTKQINVSNEAFLKPGIDYHFPSKFDYSAFDKTVSWVLQVRNVQSDSICTELRAHYVHLRFTSIGSGYFPIHYAFYLQLHDDNKGIQIINTDVEVWENNLILNVHLNKSSEMIITYLAGVDENNLKVYNVKEKPALVRHKSRQRCKSDATSSLSADPQENLKNNTQDGNFEISLKKLSKKSRRKNKRHRSFSESAYEDLKAYQEEQDQHQQNLLPPPVLLVNTNKTDNKKKNNSSDCLTNVENIPNPKGIDIPSTDGGLDASIKSSINQQRKQRSCSESNDSGLGSTGNCTYKGILKHNSRYDNWGRSLSDSCCSMDDSLSDGIGNSLNNNMDLLNMFRVIPGKNANDNLNSSESCKKTVRFSEVIKKQIFRIDSSILGQRKKNQKKRDRKMRALKRRLSEGDSVDYEGHGKLLDTLPDTDPKMEYNENKSRANIGNNNKTSECKIKNSNTEIRPRFDSESSDVDANKNSLMFDMDM